MAFVKTHLPCDDCGSSDKPADESVEYVSPAKSKGTDLKFPEEAFIGAINDRRISLTTCEKYGVQQLNDGTLYFPYRNDDGDIIAAKKRPPDKKKISIEGDWKNAEPLFGMSLFNKGSAKSVMLCEGESDTLAAFEMNGRKWPVVGIRDGASSAAKNVKAAYDWLDSFETIVVCMDNDEAGKDATKKICEVFGAKVKVVKLDEGYKDVCDYLRDRKEGQFMSRYWQAEQFVPSGLINGAMLWEELSKPMAKPAANWPYEKLDKMLCGLRQRELITIAAGSGSGKSTFLRQLVSHLLKTTEDNIGLMFLEESAARTALGIMSVEAQKPLHLPTTEVTDQEKRAAFDATMGTGRITLMNHFGSLDMENILAKMRWMAKGQGCKWIFLDHYQMTISGMDVDERKALDVLLTRLRTFVEETGVTVFGVSHTRRDSSSKGAENGAELTLSSLRGTAGIGQLSDAVIGLQRDQQNDDEKIRNTTLVRLLKSRYTGSTGPAGYLFFDAESNRLIELDEMPTEQDVL